MCGDMVASWLWTDWGTACPEWTQDSSTSARWIGAQRGVPPLTQFSSQNLVARPQWYWGEDLEGARCQVSSAATSPLGAPTFPLPSLCLLSPLSLFLLFSYRRALSLSLSVGLCRAVSLSHPFLDTPPPRPPLALHVHSPPQAPRMPFAPVGSPTHHTPCRYCKHFRHHPVCSCI